MAKSQHTPIALANEHLRRLREKLQKINQEVSFYGEKNDFDSLVHLDTLLETQNSLQEEITILSESLSNNKADNSIHFTIEFDNNIKSFNVVENNHIVDPGNNVISKDSPLAQAVLGKKEGEIFELLTPFGSKLGKILKI